MIGLDTIQAQLGRISPGVQAMDENEFAALHKALTAGYGTDVAALTGGGSLRLESLEHVLMATVQENEHFRLFNMLKKPKATATVDAWVEQSSIGGRLGGSANSELGDIQAATGQFARRTGFVKYLMTRRSVSVVGNVQEGIIGMKAVEEVNGSKQLLTDAEWLCFEGDGDAVPEEFDGLVKLITSLGDTDHVIDMEGGPFDSAGFQNILNAAATISKYGNFGKATHLFLSVLAQTDLDLDLDPAARVPLPDVPDGGLKRGSPVIGIRTTFGNIATMPDVFVMESRMPAQGENPASNTTVGPTRPQAVSPANATDAASKFKAAHAGNYYWGVAGISSTGESDLRITTQTAVAAGEKVTLTITASAAQDESGYAIYRSRKGGTNAAADMRLVARIARTAGSTTFVDYNRLIPGTSKAYVLNMRPSDDAIAWRQLLPMTRFELFPTLKAELPWAQLLFGYLRVSKRKHHVLIKNILPNQAKAVWDPFN